MCLPKIQRFASYVSFKVTAIVFLNLNRFCFSVPYALCIEKKR